ncbi:MAG: PEP-CTERM sorting domain-containing protein [Pseudomonadota bacterium]
MTIHSLILKSLPMAVVLLASGTTQAAITVYSSQASYLAAISSPGVDTFDDLIIDSAPTPLARHAGAYTYTAAAGPKSDFYGAGDGADHYLSTDNSSDTITFSNFGANVRGVGGFFFGSEVRGFYLAGGTMQLTATDTSGTVTQLIINSNTSSFRGFVSTGALSTVTLTSASPATHWVSANNLTLGVSAVPEPETYGMLLAGLAGLGFVARIKRR